MVSDHSENVEFYRYRQSDGSAIAEIEPLAEVGGVRTFTVRPRLSRRTSVHMQLSAC